jgi:predicted ATPase
LQNYILTGAPGAGKTTLIEALKSKNYFTVNEAATDLITQQQAAGVKECWKQADFIDKIVNLQKARQQAINPKELVFFDRSPICTLALATYLGFAQSQLLLEEILRITKDEIYQKQVLFVENLGFMENTNIRTISFAEALKFEEIHKNIYQSLGYELITIKKSHIAARIKQVLQVINYF